MKKEELVNHIGNYVKLLLIGDNYYQSGFLRHSSEDDFKNNPNIYLKKDYFFLTNGKHQNFPNSPIFKVSHIKHFELLENKNHINNNEYIQENDEIDLE